MTQTYTVKTMKTIKFLVLCCVVLVPAILFAQIPTVQISVKSVAKESSYEINAKRNIHHFFGGQKIKLPIIVHGVSSEAIDLQARLFQLTSSLVAPVGDVLEVFSQKKLNNHSQKEYSVSVKLPSVKRETTLELRFWAKIHSKKEWRDVGRTRIQVYPKKLLEPLKVWSENIQLRLEDNEGTLSRFLTAQEFTFMDSKAATLRPSQRSIVTLLVRNSERSSLPKHRIRAGETVIIFREGVESLPKIVVSPSGKGNLISVEMEIIKNLETDPRTQKTFLQILQLSKQVPNQ